MKQRIHELLEPAREGDRVSRYVDLLIVGLIVFSVVSLVVESERDLHDRSPGFFLWSERVVLVLFSIEYVLRLWSCTADARYQEPVTGRFRCALRPAVVVDLLAILPGLMPFIGLDLRFIRIVRVFRVLRVFKLGRYTSAFALIVRVFVKTRDELLIALIFVLTLLLIASCLMYYAESDAQPEHFGSITDSMWWAIVTLTTVGYGDVYPVTGAGRLIAGVMAVLAIGLVGLPTGILGAGFVSEMQSKTGTKNSEMSLTHGS
ncbi:MAG: ion transporter [Phycisphaerales bacterium]|nr:ion transporter [Phycisphaerales bacterium]